MAWPGARRAAGLRAWMDEATRLPGRAARFPITNLVLFLATVATTLWAGFTLSPLPAGAALSLAAVVRGGLPFSAALIAILLTHEMGHFVLARRHRVDTTLPYFIPLPFGFGTLGAVIRIRSALPTRRATLEIGAAGPIAGFLVALPLLWWGLAHSEVRAVAATAASAAGSPFELLRAWLAGRPLSAPDTGVLLYGDSLVTWATQRLVFGPLPEGMDVFVHPVAFAAWIGMFVTTLNLIPVGQLDGGHVLYALLGSRWARVGGRVASAALLAAGFFLSWNWLVWWALCRFLLGNRHPPALVEEPLSPGRRALAVASLVLLAVTFVPVPITVQ
ncbi:MAG TPA: site-2 protease family protein [Anaeromyxobacter sp.]|nr:site-2 protease family protein [Anaeromyxobacter sp.]